MKLIQCDRCGETEHEEKLPAQYSTPEYHHRVQIYRAGMYGNYKQLDLCIKCQDLANEVMARFMVATLKEETTPKVGVNGGLDE